MFGTRYDFDTYMIQLTNTNTYLFIMFGTRTYSYEPNTFVILIGLFRS